MPAGRSETIDYGLETEERRPWTEDYGLWTADYGLRTKDYGLWTVDLRLKASSRARALVTVAIALRNVPASFSTARMSP